MDEHLAGYCNEIHVTLEKDGSATVADNGRGVPVDMHAKGVSAARVVYTTLHAGGKFDNSVQDQWEDLHGVGSSVVNALSTYMDVEISSDGYIHHDRYEQGNPVVELEDGLFRRSERQERPERRSISFRMIRFLRRQDSKRKRCKSRLHETAYLNPKLTIIFEDKRQRNRANH